MAVLVTCILVDDVSIVGFAGLEAGFGDTAGAEEGEDSPSVEKCMWISFIPFKKSVANQSHRTDM